MEEMRVRSVSPRRLRLGTKEHEAKNFVFVEIIISFHPTN